MVKLFGFEFRRVAKEAVQAASAGHSQGLFARGGVDHFKPKEVNSYYDAYNDRDLIRAPIDDLVESALGSGYYTTVKDEKNGEAKKVVDEFGEHFNLDELLVNIGKNALIAGFCPTESRIVADVEKCAIKIVHPTTIEDIYTNGAEPYRITSVKQKSSFGGKTIEGAYIAHFVYGRVGNDPRGTSVVRGAINLLNTLDMATTNVDAMLDKYIAPLIIWLTTGDTEPLKKAVMERKAGEDIYIGHLTQHELELADKLVKPMTIEPRVPFWEYVEYLDRRLYSYMRSNNLWYSKDATVASAETLDKIVQRHVHTLQRSMKRAVEQGWYRPLIESNFPGENMETPRLCFGVETSGLETINLAALADAGLKAIDADGPYLTRDQYYDVWKRIGIPLKEFNRADARPLPAARPATAKDDNEPETFKKGIKELLER